MPYSNYVLTNYTDSLDIHFVLAPLLLLLLLLLLRLLLQQMIAHIAATTVTTTTTTMAATVATLSLNQAFPVPCGLGVWGETSADETGFNS